MRWLARTIVMVVCVVLGLWLLDLILPGFTLISWQAGLLGIGVLMLLNATIYPLVIRLALPFIGAPSVYAVIRGWLEKLQPTASGAQR